MEIMEKINSWRSNCHVLEFIVSNTFNRFHIFIQEIITSGSLGDAGISVISDGYKNQSDKVLLSTLQHDDFNIFVRKASF
jgi:hypothetical protein